MKQSEWIRNQAKIKKINENKLAKKEKNKVVSPKDLTFSKEEGKDYFVELCMAEEIIADLRKEIEDLRKIDEFISPSRKPRRRLLTDEELFF